MGCIWDGFDEVPVWCVEDGKAVCRDAKTGKLLKTNDLSLKDRLGIDFFEQFPVKLLRELVVGERTRKAKIGTMVYAHINPAGQVYLFEKEGSHRCFYTDAIEGVEFEIVES